MLPIEEQLIRDSLSNKPPRLKADREYSEVFYEKYMASFPLRKKQGSLYPAFKRMADIVISLSVLISFMIPMLLISVLIMMDDMGLPIISSPRVGRGGQVFPCYKFRTMRLSAPSNLATADFTDADRYITRVGWVLRKTSIDELPQFFNVLMGHMSLVGYRPLVTSETECNDMRNRMHVFRARPGITGYAQVRGRDLVYFKNKAIMDAYYVNNQCLRLDLMIIIKTFSYLLKGA